MTGSGEGNQAPTLRLRLPATSANLGPGFDTLALALALYLEIEASPVSPGTVPGLPVRPGEHAGREWAGYSIRASGRNPEICSRIEQNLLLSVYRETVLRYAGREAPPLALTMRNGIPLGMGCGSSAASRLAGVALAAHFGELGWSRDRILAEVVYLEGHPDNAAACWLGGFVASGCELQAGKDGSPARQEVDAVSIVPPAAWHALLVLPEQPLATTASRAVLPERYSRADTVRNLQRVALLTAAFSTGRGDLLRAATGDSLHQPYRSAVCPLLPCLLPLAGRAGIMSVTLSGAGPAVLLLLADAQSGELAATLVEQTLSASGVQPAAELVLCKLAAEAVQMDGDVH